MGSTKSEISLFVLSFQKVIFLTANFRAHLQIHLLLPWCVYKFIQWSSFAFNWMISMHIDFIFFYLYIFRPFLTLNLSFLYMKIKIPPLHDSLEVHSKMYPSKFMFFLEWLNFPFFYTQWFQWFSVWFNNLWRMILGREINKKVKICLCGKHRVNDDKGFKWPQNSSGLTISLVVAGLWRLIGK